MKATDSVNPPEGLVRAHRVEEVTGFVLRPDKPGAVAVAYDRWTKRHAMYPATLPRGWTPVTPFRPNKVLYEWGAIVGTLLTAGTREYRVSSMYIEFENVASPSDPVVAPSFGRDSGEGVEYYDSLALSADRDYLRVPLVASRLEVSDATKFPKGNTPVFFAQTSGVEGVHGKAFSDANNSKVFGAALVATIDDDDPTQDLVLSRFYLATSDQQVKLSNSQVGIEWELKLK